MRQADARKLRPFIVTLREADTKCILDNPRMYTSKALPITTYYWE